MRENMRLKTPQGRYDTESAQLCAEWETGQEGEPNHIHEILYRTRHGQYFLHAAGGVETKYARWNHAGQARPDERIVPLTLDEAERWLDEHTEADQKYLLFDMHQQEKTPITFTLPNSLIEQLRASSRRRRLTQSAIVAAALKAYLEEQDPEGAPKDTR